MTIIKSCLRIKLILARAEFVGTATVGLQALSELESDTVANKTGLERLEKSGNEMVAEEHFASTEITRIIEELKDLLKQLEEALSKKRVKLEFQKRVEEFRARTQNVNVWISEKLPAAQNDNYGASLGEVEALQASLKRLQNEVKGQ